ncbi:ABC transporter permease [Lentilitoribacter sp. EG35]|uniref:ABC transporter permease n=1 Tax=Lentilitoribacter sp. EG35 TaxID=3234192 RepID=UPI003460364A
MKSLHRHHEFWLMLIIALMVVGTTLRSPGFISSQKMIEIFNDSSMLIILALGQMAVILTRSIDLSMASNLALSGMIVALINAAYPEVPVPVLMLIATSCGLIMGIFNGSLVWWLGIPSIVVTLGTLTIYRGIIFVLAGGKWVNADAFTESFIQYTRVEFLGIPALSWYAIIIVLAFFIFMTRTSAGRSIYAIGINPSAALYTGINIGKTQFMTFCISGALSGFCGYLWVSRYVIGSVEVAKGYELVVVAACVIGGISIAGGVGTVIGTVLGALFLGFISNALPVIGVSPFWQMAISGGAIILAVIINASSQKQGKRIILKDREVQS